MVRVVVVGSVNLDLVARCERLPAPGETVIGATFERVPGGKGANQALAAARLGADAALVACVGDDPFAAEALALLAAGRVDLSRVRRGREPTGVALVGVAADGENAIVVASGANASLAAADVDVAGADAVLCQLEVPVAPLLEAARRAPGLFCLNAAPAAPVPPELVERADLVVVNEGERAAFGELVLAARGVVAVTLGAEGAILLERGREVARAAPPAVRATDTTGAGDAFCAALAVGLAEGRPREEALARACAAGALAASRPGAQPSLPTAAELAAVLAP